MLLAWSFLPPEITNVQQFLIIGGIAAAISTMAKAGFGGGLGMLSTPLMVIACGENAQLGLGIMLPQLIVSDYVILGKWWGKWNARAALSLAPGALVGLGLGWMTLGYFQNLSLQASAGMTPQNARHAVAAAQNQTNGIMILCIGLIAVIFVLLHIFRTLRRNPLPFKPVLWQASSIGLAAGYTSTMAHAAGPIVTMYLLPQGMPKTKFVATTALYYWYGNQIKLLPYICMGFVTWQTITANIVLLPAVGVGMLVGVYLHHKVGEKNFAGVVHILLGLAGLDLICRAMSKLWAIKVLPIY